MSDELTAKTQRFQGALDALVERLSEDRTVLGVVRVGSFSPDTLWNADHGHLQVLIADGSAPRVAADGDDPRIFRTVVEHDLEFRCELVERAQFKRMVEGNARNTAGWSVFCARELVYAAEPEIEQWFASANTPSKRDQRHDQLTIACWLASTIRTARRRLKHHDDLPAALEDAMHLAWAVACLAIVDAGEVVEHHLRERALELEPELMGVCFTTVRDRRDEASIRASCDAAEAHLRGRWEALMDPILRFVDRFDDPVPLSELAAHFATSALYPSQIAGACAWLVEEGHLTLLSAPMPLTKKSRVRIEEPAWTRA